MKEGISIKQISKFEKEYGIENKFIRKKVHKTTHNKNYVDDSIAMKIWIALDIHQDKVLKIKKDIEERTYMANEPY